MATYRTGVFRVAGARANPTIATALLTVICQVRSFHLPELHETASVAIPASKYGGQVRTRPMVWLKMSATPTPINRGHSLETKSRDDRGEEILEPVCGKV
jgi:hypothetical protein